MRFRDACFIKYCRAKKTTEKLKFHAEYKVLRTEVKMKTKEAKKKITRIYSKKIKQIYQKIGNYLLYCQSWRKK